ncbi:glycosyltransferase [Flavihumibacter rivuli]|uniref:glycosyltransferase n=1 Tax=Flavihumibacter rivuli TaxID=2838156 RepID=UPI001BDE269A|nr:glycosyltransferase [Flavihumibacter rivuli]ULQ56268.1 glycosyltransferase [Flavihumibacter rivuli]
MPKRIMFFVDWFDPAYKAGGPITSTVNFVRNLGNDYAINVFTSNYDIDGVACMTAQQQDAWIDYKGKARVWYASGKENKWQQIRQAIQEQEPDVLYCNSMFSVTSTIIPLLLKKLGFYKGKVILAPNGMLRPSALQFKPAKKKAFLKAFRLLGLHRLVCFHATDQEEKKNIESWFGKATIKVLPNFPADPGEETSPLPKTKGQASLLFVGRIHPIKQVDYLLDCLKGIEGEVDLGIIGPLEDPQYWKACEGKIAGLDKNIKVTYLGEMPPGKLKETMQRYHYFVLPTRGENFGHVIFEALVLGKPALISDQTPWTDLDAHEAGWVLPLANKGGFQQAIQNCVAMTGEVYAHYSGTARAYALDFLRQSSLKEQYHSLLS